MPDEAMRFTVTIDADAALLALRSLCAVAEDIDEQALKNYDITASVGDNGKLLHFQGIRLHEV